MVVSAGIQGKKVFNIYLVFSAEPWASNSLPDHIGCSKGSCKVMD